MFLTDFLFPQVKKIKGKKPPVITTDCCLSSSVSSLIFLYQNFETTDWVSQLDPVSSDGIQRVMRSKNQPNRVH